MEFFVGCVQVVVGQPEAHQDAGQAQFVLKKANNGDGSARSDEHCLIAEDLFHGSGCCFDERVGGIHHARGRAMKWFPFSGDARGANGCYGSSQLFACQFRSLIGN